MQVSVEATEGLEKRITIEVPADNIQPEVKKRLRAMQPDMKMQGFRPGKVPMSVVEKRFGKQVIQEVTNEVINRSFYDAVSEKELKPAGRPTIESQAKTADNGLTFTATFEVYPEFEVTGVETLIIEKPVTEIANDDIDDLTEKLRAQHASWETVDRPAQIEDQIKCDFKGSINGEVFKGGEGQDMPLVLGSGRMISGFEDGLIGKSAGETVTLDLTFPEDYHSKDVAGKEASFCVTINSVEQQKLPEVDNEFIEKFGVEEGGIDAFREELKNNMRRELDRVLSKKVKDQIMDKLLLANTFDIPKSMINAEGARIAKQMNEQLQASGNQLPKNMQAFQGDQFEEEGKRRVALGLILSKLVEENNLKAEVAAVKAEVEKIATSYDDPQQVINWYYQDKSRLAEIESMVLENQVVDWVLEQAQVTDKVISFKEIMSDVNRN